MTWVAAAFFAAGLVAFGLAWRSRMSPSRDSDQVLALVAEHTHKLIAKLEALRADSRREAGDAAHSG